MERWFKRINIFLLVIFGLLYIAAKVHFFTRYGVLGPGGYLEDHWPLWAGLAVVGGVGAGVDWIRRRWERSRLK
jgi:hypothetical protein